MTDRDELADLIMDVFDAHDEGHQSTADDAAQRILARWRLVPVTPAARQTTVEQLIADADAQHRAASELTRHDQDAGHYDA